MTLSLFKLGNLLYKYSYPLYLQLYRKYKYITDSRERKLIGKYLKAGSTAVDVGANIGIYTEFMSNIVGVDGAVHAFEPSAENFIRLQQYTRNCRNVHLNQKAVGDVTGKLKLYISDDLNVDHRTYPSGEARRTLDIDSIRLDDYFCKGEKIDFIKMDIQGFEYHAFMGMPELLRNNKDIKILFEFWPYGLKAAGAGPNELIGLLKRHGFELFILDKKGIAILSELKEYDKNEYVNIFAAREEIIQTQK
jgi:FkbM family methyltransferase